MFKKIKDRSATKSNNSGSHWALIMYALLHSLATLTEVFPCFLLSCKANARVYLAKTGHVPHSS